MTDHADTIRRIVRHAKLSNEADAALDALLGERQQDKHELRRLQETNKQLAEAGKVVVAERQQAQTAYEDAISEAGECSRQRQQAIEALREADRQMSNLHDILYSAFPLESAARAAVNAEVWKVHEILRTTLAKLGEQPK